jgi:hypothetical protein
MKRNFGAEVKSFMGDVGAMPLCSPLVRVMTACVEPYLGRAWEPAATPPLHSRFRLGFVISPLLAGFLCCISFAANATPTDIDDLLGGFDDEPVTTVVLEDDETSNWSFSGFVSFNSHYNYKEPTNGVSDAEFEGVSRARLRFFPELKVNLGNDIKGMVSASNYYDAAFDWQGKSGHTDSYIKDSRTEVELRQLHLSTSLTEKLDVKLGRQILVWGKSDNIRVTDIINPVDFREPGMIDLSDLRLPTGMIRADYYQSNWHLNVALIPEFEGNKSPVYGSEFYPADQLLPVEVKPKDWSDWQTAVALNGTFEQWDVSFYLADAYQHDTYLLQVGEKQNNFQMAHSQYQMAGIAGNWVVGSWLLKSEAAWRKGLELSYIDHEVDRYDWLVGFDYEGFNNQTLTLEYAMRHLKDYGRLESVAQFEPKKNESELVLRYSGKFFREALDVSIFAYYYGLKADASRLYRASASYKMLDNWNFTAGWMVYSAGDKDYFERIADNDRLYFEVRFDF